MVISPENASKRSSVSSSSKSDVKKIWGVKKNMAKNRMLWEVKQNLAKKRLMDLTLKNKNAEPGNMDGPIVCFKAKLHPSNDPHNCAPVSTTSAMERAQEIRGNLSLQFPSFLKLMLGSHVTGGFWLGLPKKFCDVHLPKHDDTVVLVDEDEQEYDTKYLVYKNGLSGGWRGFSIAHKLLAGDVLVFHLIESCKFKVYIVRANGSTEVDRAIGLLNLDFHKKAIDTEMVLVKMDDQTEDKSHTSETAMQKYSNPLAVAVDNHQEKNRVILISDSEPAADQSGDDSDNLGSEVVEGIRFSESVVNFKDVKDFADFHIHVNGLILDSEIPTHLRTKYYGLCCSQKKFLHENLINDLNSKLAAGMISEIINIADGIKSAKLTTTSLHYLEIWDKTLKAFEDLGMAVGFLRARIYKLVTLSCESQAIIAAKRRERDEARAEMKALETKLLNVKALIKSLNTEVNDLEVKHEELGSVFKEVAGVSW